MLKVGSQNLFDAPSDAKGEQMSMLLEQTGSKDITKDIGNNPVLMVLKLFALSPNEHTFTTRFANGDGYVYLRIEGNEKLGPATQHDKSFLAFVLTRMLEMKEQGKDFRTLRVSISEYLRKMGINSSGHAYHQVNETIDRLTSTKVYTNVELQGDGVVSYFNWIQSAKVHYTTRMIAGESKRCMTSFTIVPCEWIVNAAERGSFVEYAKGYFQLKSQLMQRIYEVVSTETQKDIFKIRMQELMERTGCDTSTKTFKKNLKRQIVGESGKPPTNVPEHAIYPYTEAHPETSCAWGARVLAEKQWFVFVRGQPQTNELNIHLDDIPEWQPSLNSEDLNSLGVWVAEEEEDL